MTNLDAIREKRLKTLVQIWEHLVDSKKISNKLHNLNKVLVAEVIEHYIQDVCVLKQRYKIEDRIQTPKIAGLMASAIVRFRPIIPLVDKFEAEDDLYVNELFAIYHGLCVCGEFSNSEALKNFLDDSLFDEWYDKFQYLLHHRNYTSESLILIFETVSRFVFPEVFESDA